MTELEKPLPTPFEIARRDEYIDRAQKLVRSFDNERSGREPFEVRLQCTICQDGIVHCWYKEPLYGGMTCDTPGCLKLHF